jgi:hypothetical protein
MPHDIAHDLSYHRATVPRSPALTSRVTVSGVSAPPHSPARTPWVMAPPKNAPSTQIGGDGSPPRNALVASLPSASHLTRSTGHWERMPTL